MKEQILELFQHGLTIQQIHHRLGCARATIAYHVSPVSKEQTLTRIKRQREIKKASRPLKVPKIKVKKEKPVKEPMTKSNTNFKDKKEPVAKKKERHFKNKDQKLQEKVLFRLDHKTQVYAYPDADINKLRAKWLK
jgi:hypothetical protein